MSDQRFVNSNPDRATGLTMGNSPNILDRHYIGSHRNRLKFQEQYECFFLIADLHMLTTKPDKEHRAHRRDRPHHRDLTTWPSASTHDQGDLLPAIGGARNHELQLLLSSLVTGGALAAITQRSGHGRRGRHGSDPRTTCLAIRSCRRRISSCRAPTWFR